MLPEEETTQPANAEPAADTAPELNGNTKPLVLAVGESVPVSQAHIDSLLEAERVLQKHLLDLGAHRNRMLMEEAHLMRLCAMAQQAFEKKVKEAGTSIGLVFEGDFAYNYDQSARTFTRTR